MISIDSKISDDLKKVNVFLNFHCARLASLKEMPRRIVEGFAKPPRQGFLCDACFFDESSMDTKKLVIFLHGDLDKQLF